MEGRRPAKRPARTIAPIDADSFRDMETASKTATPAKNAIPVSSKNLKRFSLLGIRIAPAPPARTVEPMSPPMSAWLLDVGRPHHQVIKSQAIAPNTPAR